MRALTRSAVLLKVFLGECYYGSPAMIEAIVRIQSTYLKTLMAIGAQTPLDGAMVGEFVRLTHCFC
jgi:hypothetical protein